MQSARPKPPSEREPLAGLVERVTFHNADNGFCVLRVKARGHRDLVTVLGAAPSISAGEYIQASGTWENNREHGLQFRAAFLRASAPTSAEGMEKYLGSGLIKGIGPAFAQRLVSAFNEAVFEVIEHAPQRLLEVEGIGPKRARRITSSWADQKVIREIMAFLQGHGVGTSRAVRIFKTYGADAIPLVTENPYRLARDITGIGFKSADLIAERLGIERTAMVRARAGIAYTLAEAMSNGHCGLAEDELLIQAEKLLEIPSSILAEALLAELATGAVVADTIEGRRCIFLAHLWRAEKFIAQRLQTLIHERPPWPVIDVERALGWVEKKFGLKLAPSQRAAVALALASKPVVVTGGPGVGKTTLVNSILKILCAKSVAVALCAPTGRAAKRLAESTGLAAKTIHRLLEADPRHGGFKRGETNPLQCDLLVVDEVSMVDVPLMAALMRALPPQAGLLLVGDADQLPSVGPGQVLANIINSAVVPTARLTEVFRQAAQSRIVTNAHRINRGQMPELSQAKEGSDFYFVEADEPDDAAGKITEIVCRRIPAQFGLDPIREVQVLCPMNRGRIGARSLNLDLQAALNGDPSKPAVVRFGCSFRSGDKVMQTVNDYDKEVFNGDLGFVHSVDLEAQELVIDFDGRMVNYDFGELDEIVPAYAITIHKAQGSEYPAVVIPLSTQHYPMLRRNLVYTGITRGKRLVVLVGQRKALTIAVRDSQAERRWSKLHEWLCGETALEAGTLSSLPALQH
jgi:exodeoxyribonuclease V alpha subunit